jgi:hypothetical protein
VEYDAAKDGRQGDADRHAQPTEKILAIEKFLDLGRIAHRVDVGRRAGRFLPATSLTYFAVKAAAVARRDAGTQRDVEPSIADEIRRGL